MERYVEVPTTPLWAKGGAASVRVRYVVRGEGPALVLVHGLGASLSVWNENIEELSRAHRVFALDLPGHGESDKPGELYYDSISGAHFLTSFMDAVGIDNATLMGNSAGGHIAAACALRYPQRLDRLILVSSAGLGREMAWFLRASSLPLLGELLQLPIFRNVDNLKRAVFYEPPRLNDALLEDLTRAHSHPGAKRAVLRAIRSEMSIWGLRKHMQLFPELKEFRKPLLIIWGREDRIIPVSHAHRAGEVLDGKVHIIPRSGHWPQLETPEEFNEVVLGFLSRTAGELERP